MSRRRKIIQFPEDMKWYYLGENMCRKCKMTMHLRGHSASNWRLDTHVCTKCGRVTSGNRKDILKMAQVALLILSAE